MKIKKSSLQVRLPLLAVLLSMATACVLWVVVEYIVGSQKEKEAGELLSRRALTLAGKIDRALYERYQNITLHANLLAKHKLIDRPELLGQHLDALKRSYEGYAWIGYAGMDGRVLEASDGLLKGSDISQRPWYAGALKANYLGGPHRALLLEKKLNTNELEPLRFLDIAIPVLTEKGSIAGVLGAHIDWRWIRTIAQSMPPREQSEFMIVADNGLVLLGPPELQDKILPQAMAERMEKGKSGYDVAHWPDNKLYLAGYSRSMGYQSFPGLNWLIIERHHVELAYAPTRALLRQLMLWSLLVAGIFALAGWIAARRITKPLLIISKAAEAIERGDTKTNIPLMSSYHEVTVLASALASLISQLTKRESELEQSITRNPLTQLPNRVLTKALIDQAITLARQENNPLTVMTVGFGGFGLINNTMGNAVGDALLKQISQRLQSASANATLCHIGRDEFALIMRDQGEALMQTASTSGAIEEAVERPFLVEDTPYYVYPVMGVSQYPKDANDADALLSHSEVALHEARKQGGRCIEFYQAEMNSSVLQRMELERDLRLALAAGQLELHYQPQYSLSNDRLMGVEALIRWRHPHRGYISPMLFIPVAEASGLILPIGKWVLHEACRQAAAWRHAGLPSMRIAVNVSSRQFAEANLTQQVTDALSQYKLPSTCLKLEITESMLMQDVDRAITTMQELVDIGVRLAIDDFGTGYSSLSYLGRFCISELKIDQSFVRNLPSDADNAAIVHTIISLARNLKLGVIAEGVESEAQVDFLKDAGCHDMQGYYFSKPLDSESMTKILQERKGLL
jgi:diguanylate cyclase (GGDEF)-like protein